MSESPAFTTPDWDQTAVPSVYAASILSIAISGLFFLGRIASRRIQRQSLSVSDYVLMFSVFCTWAVSIINMYMTRIGLGRHFDRVAIEDPSLSNVILLLKLLIPDEAFYDVGLGSIKISILLLYRSIFPGRKFAMINNILMAVVVAWILGNLLPSIFSCRPISGFWNIKMSPPPVCINKKVLYIAGSSTNIATDFAILTLPVTKVLHLQMHNRTKVALIFVFLLGGLVCIVSIYRFTVLLKADSPDLTWEFASVLNWTVAEMATGVASACLPVMQPLVRAVIPAAWSPTVNSRAQVSGTALSRMTTKNRGYGFWRRSEGVSHMGSQSEFKRLPENNLSVAESGRHKRSEVLDLDSDYNMEDGIVVTKTFEMKPVT